MIRLNQATKMIKKISNRHWSLSLAVGVLLFPLSVSAQAQQQKKIHRIGRVAATFASADTTRMEAFRHGLRELGYIEGQNIVIEWRFAQGKVDRLRELVGELVRLKMDLIVTGGPSSTRASKEATSTIPIVMTNDTDPVASGMVASLDRPGGNITGVSNFSPELSGKRLEILREVVPKLSRVAILGTSTRGSTAGQMLTETEPAAKAFGVELQYLAVLDIKDIETSFRAANNGRAQAVLTLPNPILNSQREKITDLATKNRLPAIYHQGRFIDAGGLMFYGVDLLDLDRRAATYVDKILKGGKPADLPIERPTKFEFVINLHSAKQIGQAIPQKVLARADKVIK
jgi:putative ABC transport system substrate-binding protein